MTAQKRQLRATVHHRLARWALSMVAALSGARHRVCEKNPKGKRRGSVIPTRPLWMLPLATLIGCTSPSAPVDSTPEVTVSLLLSRPFFGELLPAPTVGVSCDSIIVTLHEWFADGNYNLAEPALTFSAPGPGVQGAMHVPAEANLEIGNGIVWRKDHSLTIQPVPSGTYQLTVLRYDQGLGYHPDGNPRMPVNTVVVVP